MKTDQSIPIITIDGTSASGKGTIATKLSTHFKYNYLNSGALFRMVAHTASQQNIPIHSNLNPSEIEKLVAIASNLSFSCIDDKIISNSIDIWPILKTEHTGTLASIISIYEPVRKALLRYELAQVLPPGLVAEGRDMAGVFTNAVIKIYLDASLETKAKRRYKDEDHTKVSYEQILADQKARDDRDKQKLHGKLILHTDSHYIDTSDMTIEQVFNECLNICLSKIKTP